MNNRIINVQFGDTQFEVRDVWPSNVTRDVSSVVFGPDEGYTYLSFPITDEQRKFLGNTPATHFRVQIKKLS